MTRGCLFLIAVVLVSHLTFAEPFLDLTSPTDQVERMLQTRYTFDVGETTIEGLAKYMRHRLRLTVMIDETALQDEGIDSNQPVTPLEGSAKLETFLDLTFQPQGVDYFVKDGVLVITTEVVAVEALECRVYPVADLVSLDAYTVDYEHLINAIYKASSQDWDVTSGVGGTISPVPATEALVIHHCRRVHREIEGLLSTLRSSRGLPQVPSLKANPSEQPAAADLSDIPETSPATRTFSSPTPVAGYLLPRVYGDD